MKIASRFAWIAAALLPLAVSAQEATPEPARHDAVLDRAEVRQALEQARRDGTMKVFRSGYVGEVTSQRSRAEVMAEVRHARDTGELAALNAEAAGFGQPQRSGDAPRWMAQRGR